MNPFIFQRGETISVALDAVSGNPLDVTAITAGMKAVAPGRTSVSPDAPVAASFVISNRAAQGEIPSGWTLTIPASVSATLSTGSYLADARIEVAGGVVLTEPLSIRIAPSVSA